MRTDYDFDLLCIGSGPDAQHAAVQAAKFGKRVAVVEKPPSEDSACLGMGTIPAKTFREAVCCCLEGHGSFGPYQVVRPESAQAHGLSVEELLHRVSIIGRRESRVMEQHLSRNDVRLIRGEAAFVDPHTLLLSSGERRRTVTVRNIVIDVGTYPSSPPGVPADGDTILTSDDLAQLRRLPKKLLVVGGGIIGIEYASMFAAMQIEVVVVDKRERLLEFLDWEAVGELMCQMRKQRVTFRLGEAVERLEITAGTSRQGVVYLESGKSIIADQVLFLVGRIGATCRLNLDVVGLKPDDRGRLAVDREFRTTVPNIFAVGDVIGSPSWGSASFSQGGLAACYAFGVETRSMVAHLPIGIYALPEVSAIGPPEHDLVLKKIPYVTGIARYRSLARRQLPGGDSGFLKLLFHREDHRLLGVHVVGSGATELIHIGQTVMESDGGVQSFLKAVFNYPKLADCYKVAALDAFNKLSCAT